MGTADIEVRRARVDDVDEILSVLGAVAEEGLWLATASAIDFSVRRERFVATATREDAAMFVAIQSGKVVGELSIIPENAGVLGIGMAVAAAWRGRGVGSRLLEAALDFARSVGAHKVTLEVFPHNVAALALYEKFKFVREGMRLQHYRRENGELWDSILMGRVLA